MKFVFSSFFFKQFFQTQNGYFQLNHFSNLTFQLNFFKSIKGLKMHRLLRITVIMAQVRLFIQKVRDPRTRTDRSSLDRPGPGGLWIPAKGGIVLNMVRCALGDNVFFGGLNKYLEANQYKSVTSDMVSL